MNTSIFDPSRQNEDLSGKVIAGLERISEAFKVLLWDKAKQLGLSPIQIQLLIFIAYHKAPFCNVSHLAKEFNVTKPTISDAVRVLQKKKLVEKDFSGKDSRSYTIFLSDAGKDMVKRTENFADPMRDQFQIAPEELQNLFGTLSKFIYQLNKAGILNVQRTCYGCKFYDKKSKTDYCNLLQKELQPSDIRIDCPEYSERD